MFLYFDPDGADVFDDDEFFASVFMDPFNTNGDGGFSAMQSGKTSSAPAPAGLVVLCPGNQPSPIRFEWKIPFAALGITAGSAHSPHFAIFNFGGGQQTNPSSQWPATLGLTDFSKPPATAAWGELSSTASWK